MCGCGLAYISRSSLGEFVLPTKTNMEGLIDSLERASLPIGTFIIDDGWQDVCKNYDGGPDNECLWSFDAYAGLSGSLKETVETIKARLPTVKNVGVWMS